MKRRFFVVSLIALAFALHATSASEASASTVYGTTGTAPYAIATDSLGNIYVANTNSNDVTKIATDGTVSTFGSTGNAPVAIAVDATGNVFTANSVDNTVTEILSTGNSLIYGTTGANPDAIAIDPAGNVYTANHDSGDVSKIDSSHNSAIIGTTHGTPVGIVVDSSGNVFTANAGTNDITEITSSGVNSVFAQTGQTPSGIVIDGAGNLYVSNLGDSTVTKITPGGVASVFGTTGTAPNGIAIFAGGDVYTVNSGSNNVTKITAAGISTTYGSVGPNPGLIAVDGSTNVYVPSTANNNVTKVSALQVPTFSLSTPTETAIVGHAISGYAITSTGDPINGYAISPSPTNGLSFNSTTGLLSGTPIATSSQVAYQITAFNASGPSNVTYSITVNPAAPAFTLSSTSENTQTKATIHGYTVISTGGPIDSFSVSPALSTGLSFDPHTGQITGSVRTVGTRVYTITGTNVTGSASATFTLNTILAAPVLTLSVASDTAFVGAGYTAMTITNSGGAATYSISPALTDSGLQFSSVNGRITGTPTVTAGPVTYTITATNTTGTASVSFTLTVSILPYLLPTFVVDPVFVIGTVGSLLPVYNIYTNHGGVATYAISPALSDPGLSFNTSTGIISGIPTVTAPATNYTITATNTYGSFSRSLTFVILPAAPVISLSSTSETALVGHPITGYTITSTGGPVDYYSISPSLTDTGLYFDGNTGLLSGTPNTTAADITYTITATNATASATATFDLTIQSLVPAPSITLSRNSENVTVGHQIIGYIMTNTGGPITSYSISPAISNGVSFDGSSGIIYGSPLAYIAPITYTITAIGVYGSSSVTYTLNFQLPNPPQISINTTSEHAVVGQPITGYSITNTGGSATYTIAPSPTNGLSFDSTTGLLSGTPLAPAADVTYTITATNADGSVSATFDVAVATNIPSFTLLSNSISAVIGSSFSGPTITSNGATITSYTLTPSLPNGLSFNSSTGLITGTPVATQSSTLYTLTAISGAYSTSFAQTFTLTVVPIAPNITLSRNTETVAVGQSVVGYTITNSGGPISSYSISPGLSNGISFNSVTGVLYGSPTSAFGNLTFTITAINAGGTSSASYTITAIPAPPLLAPQITLSRTTETIIIGNSISGYTITNTGGAITRYSIDKSVPSGLTFNTSNGLMSGRPRFISSTIIYTITARNSAGTSTATYSLTVNPLAPLLSIGVSSVSVQAGQPFPNIPITSTGGTVDRYSISPALTDPGLGFQALYGNIYGVPTQVTAPTTYTITGTNATGSFSVSFVLTITPPPASISFSQNNETAMVGVPIDGYQITNNGGPIDYYSISPAPTNGLSFDTTTGLLSGTPIAPAADMTYTITAYSSATNTVSAQQYDLLVIPLVTAPVFSLTATSEVATSGHAISGYTINSTGDAIDYFSISPSLPAGLQFDSSTGLITGIPTVSIPATTYTITAANAGGTTTATFRLTINTAPSVVVTPGPTPTPTPTPTSSPTPSPSHSQTPAPTPAPTPTTRPTTPGTQNSVVAPTPIPSTNPSLTHTQTPSALPTPTSTPTHVPQVTASPTAQPSNSVALRVSDTAQPTPTSTQVSKPKHSRVSGSSHQSHSQKQHSKSRVSASAQPTSTVSKSNVASTDTGADLVVKKIAVSNVKKPAWWKFWRKSSSFPFRLLILGMFAHLFAI